MESEGGEARKKEKEEKMKLKGRDCCNGNASKQASGEDLQIA